MDGWAPVHEIEWMWTVVCDGEWCHRSLKPEKKEEKNPNSFLFSPPTLISPEKTPVWYLQKKIQIGSSTTAWSTTFLSPPSKQPLIGLLMISLLPPPSGSFFFVFSDVIEDLIYDVCLPPFCCALNYLIYCNILFVEMTVNLRALIKCNASKLCMTVESIMWSSSSLFFIKWLIVEHS